MALKVVGSGLGRTGTRSLKTALTQLGFGPCHHMEEVFANPASMALWVEAGAGRPDWEAIFDGFVAMVDYPGARYWRELAAYYPDAKVLHSVRDPDAWFDSTQATIFSLIPATGGEGPMIEFMDSFLGDIREHIHDRAYMTDHFRRHTQTVLETIPANRLLVFEATDGWEPLCAFLGVPVPDTPYPAQNSTAEFQARSAGSVTAAMNLPNKAGSAPQ